MPSLVGSEMCIRDSWEAAMEVIKLVPSEKNRRALWAWAISEAGGKAFAKWCRNDEGISRQLGDYRKNGAIKCIARACLLYTSPSPRD